MLHLVVMSLFVACLLRDALAIDAGMTPPLLGPLGAGGAAALTLGPMALAVAAAQAWAWALGRRIDRTGRGGLVARADAGVGLSRLAIALAHGAGVLALGWLDVVRAGVGDLVLVDELLAAGPALLALLAGWWTIYPIDRRVREALLLRDLDEGRAVHPIPSRRQFVLMGARHHLALTGVPTAMIVAWGEVVGRAAERLAGRGALSEGVQAQVAAAHIAGAVAALGLVAPVMTKIWSTAPLGDGGLRARLSALCRRHRVRVRRVLVWRTGGTMANGAVMGLFPFLRYILLTDALLEGLRQREVEAVMAHEVGHIRRHHMAWLGSAMLATLLWAGAGAQWAAGAWLGRGAWAEAAATAAALVAAALVFGLVSRRFEWQADAFAAAHLSGQGPDAAGAGAAAGAPPPAGPRITAESAAAMSSALERVAALNHIDPDRFTWRHGSIATRWRRLGALVGRPCDRLPIDRQVRGIKIATGGALALGVGLVVWSAVQ